MEDGDMCAKVHLSTRKTGLIRVIGYHGCVNLYIHQIFYFFSPSMQKGEKIVILVAATESKPSNSIFNIGINTFLINFDKVQLKKKDHQDDFQNF